MLPEVRESKRLSNMLRQMMQGVPEREHVSISVIHIYGRRGPDYGGFQDLTFCYTASLPKVYVAAAVLKKEDELKKSGEKTSLLKRKLVITETNFRDKVPQVLSDLRPILKPDEEVAVEDLLDLMITRSDNTAANTLIDLVSREYVNEIIAKYSWQGSEVTRKFLPRELEEERYQYVPPTLGCTRHLAEFFYLIGTNSLFNNANLSSTFKFLLEKQLDNTKLRAGLPAGASFAHKTGWYNDDQKLAVSGDCGVVKIGGLQYAVSCLVRLPWKGGLLHEIGQELHCRMRHINRARK